jgi:hypothetical protein
LRVEFVCRNQHDKEVMTGHAVGIVRHETATSAEGTVMY